MASAPARAVVISMVRLARWVALALTLVAAPRVPPAGAAGPAPRVGLVTTSPATRDAFVRGLQELGYQDGRNIMVDWRRAPEDGGADIEALVRQAPACLVLPGPFRLARGLALTTTIPIVALDLESDPVASRFVASLPRPGGNVTGIFLDLPELAGKHIQLLREAVPRLRRLAVLWDERVSGPQLRAAEAAAQAAGIALTPVPIRAAADLNDAVDRAMKARPQALLVLTSPDVFAARARIAESAHRHRLPAASIFPAFADAGGLLGYGPDLLEMYRQAAKYVDRVLQGARPSDLPIERPSKFQFVVNLKTARALGLTIPASLLARADKVIE
jgi:putative ABC transport system substrate-binding protein